MLKKNLLSFLKVIWSLAVIMGACYYFYSNIDKIEVYFSKIELSRLMLSFGFLMVVRLFIIDLVRNSLVSIGWQPGFSKAFGFVSISQMGKYIPGGIWQYVARFSSYQENGIPLKKSAKAFILENIWLILGSLLVSLFFLFISQPDALLFAYNLHIGRNVQYFLAAIALFIWMGVLVFAEYYFRPTKTNFSAGKLAWNLFSQTLMWILYGFSFYLLFNRQFAISDLSFFIGAFGLSFFAGYIAIFAPGGLGIREAAAVLLFSALFSTAEMSVYTVVHRFLYTLVEVFFAGISIFLIQMQKKPNKKKIIVPDK